MSSAGNGPPQIAHAALSDVGMRRANNQDSYAVAVATSEERFAKVGHLFVVADGMGAHAAGELASRMAAEKIPHYYLRSDGSNAGDALRRAVIGANNDIHRRGQENPEFHNMGTTASSLVLLPQGALIGHVGDSRVYRLRGDVFEQLTFDHSLVWEMQASGQIRPGSELSDAIPKNVITRSLGPNSEVAVDVEVTQFLPGDVFLLCSDGLSGQVTDEEMGALLTALDPELATRVLVDLANLRGGPDNITVIIVKVVNGSTPAGETPTKSPRGALNGPLVATTAAALSAAVLFFLLQSWPLSIICFLVGLVLGVIVLKLYLAPAPAEPEAIRGPTRSMASPYRRYSARPKAELVEHLISTISQIRRVSEQRRWRIDWSKVDKSEQSANEALRAGKLVEALRHQAQAINFTMAQLRDQQNRAAGDTTVDL